MGNLLGLVGLLIPLAVGIVMILYFGGYRMPQAGDEQKLERFNALKEKHGKKLVVLGVILTIIYLFRIALFLS